MKDPSRTITTIGLALIAAGIVYGGIAYVNNPYAERRDAIAAVMSNTQSDWTPPPTPNRQPPEVLESTIVTKHEVWRPLVEAPKAAPKTYDIQGAISGLEVTRQSIGQRVRIIAPQSPKGDFYSAGDPIGDVRIKQITSDAVIFHKVVDGKEYTASKRRP